MRRGGTRVPRGPWRGVRRGTSEVWGMAPSDRSLRFCWPSSLLLSRCGQQYFKLCTGQYVMPRRFSGGPRPPLQLRWPRASRSLRGQRLCSITGPLGGGQGRVWDAGFLSQSSPRDGGLGSRVHGSCPVARGAEGAGAAVCLSPVPSPLSSEPQLTPQARWRAPLPGGSLTEVTDSQQTPSATCPDSCV